MVLVDERGGDGKVNAEPVGRPTRAERLANLSRGELVRSCILEGGAREVWRRVDLKLDVRMTRGTLGFDLTARISVSLYDEQGWYGYICTGASLDFCTGHCL
jgi:hypothetical protein